MKRIQHRTAIPLLLPPDQSAAANGIDVASFVPKTCLPYLRAAQNDDGGWVTQGLKAAAELDCMVRASPA